MANVSLRREAGASTQNVIMPEKVVLRSAALFAVLLSVAQLALIGFRGLAGDIVPLGEFALVAIVTSVVALPVICFSVLTAERNRATIAHLAKLAETDALTGILNRRGFHAALARVKARLKGGESAGVVLFLDADHFKAINDRFGHQTGDHALSILGAVLKSQTRESDICGRLGGVEVAVLLRAANFEQGLHVAERIRSAVAERTPMLGRPGISLTVSIGLAVHQPGSSLEACIRQADKRLHEAKSAGRNRVSCHLELVKPAEGSL
jgi:diguanylate cyclase (GGDEF)-like protein